MASKIILVLISFSFMGLFATDTSFSEHKLESPFIQNNNKAPTAEELKASFGVSSKINLWGYFWKMTLIFLLLIALVFIFSRYFRNNSLINHNSQNNNHFKILYQQYISSKQKIILVRAFKKYLLLAVSDQSINYITEFNKNEINENNINSTSHNSLFNTFLNKFYQNEK